MSVMESLRAVRATLAELIDTTEGAFTVDALVEDLLNAEVLDADGVQHFLRMGLAAYIRTYFASIRAPTLRAYTGSKGTGRVIPRAGSDRRSVAALLGRWERRVDATTKGYMRFMTMKRPELVELRDRSGGLAAANAAVADFASLLLTKMPEGDERQVQEVFTVDDLTAAFLRARQQHGLSLSAVMDPQTQTP